MSRVVTRITLLSAPIIDKTMNKNNNENDRKEDVNMDEINNIKNNKSEINKQITSLFNTPIKSIGGPISFGLIMGGCAGYATKKVTKIAAGFIGITFIGLQILQHNGYINIDWNKVEKDIIKAVDQNNDGKLDEKDLIILKQKYMSVIAQSMLSGSGFAAGFLMGIRYG